MKCRKRTLFRRFDHFTHVKRTEGGIFFEMSYSIGYLEPWNAKRICLGLEPEDCYERMGKYLGEIRAVTGIAPE